MARIELVNLTKSYGPIVAVRNLSFIIEDGEFIVFVGPSGCGKTTTLRLIAGFEEPNAGEIRIDGRVVNDLEPRDRDLGMVFQSHALFPHKTVAQNIEFGLRMKKVPARERARSVREVAEMVRLTGLLDKLPSACSGGEAQRVALARTLVTNPSIFLLDEPLSSLDAKLRRELRAECDRLHQQLKKTFIYVTHDQEEAMTLADRIVVMRAGQIEQTGSPMEIYSDPTNDFVADFFGSPSMNLVGGEVSRDGAGPRFCSPWISLSLPELLNDIPAGAATLGIRPEHVIVRRASAEPADIDFPVRLVEPLGKDTLLYFDVGTDRPFIAVSEGLSMADMEEGARVSLTFAREQLFLFGGDGKRIARGAPAGSTDAGAACRRGQLSRFAPFWVALPQDLREAFGGDFAIGARDIEMGHGAHDAGAERGDQNPRLLRAGDDRRRVGRPRGQAKNHDVGLDRSEIEFDCRQPGDPLGEKPCIGVILGEPLEVMVERPQPGRRENARLAHRAAKHAPRPYCPRRCRRSGRQSGYRPDSPAPSTTPLRRGRRGRQARPDCARRPRRC